MKSSLRFFLILGLAFCTTTAIWGQATTSLRGTVVDPSGSAIRGAKVTIVNSGTNSTRQTQTGADGTYVFVELLPATYSLTVEAPGFKKYVENGVVLRVDLPGTVNVQMKVGAIAETISVTAEAPPLNTTDASVGQTMDANAIENIPLPAENTVLLLSLQPGVAFNGENLLADGYDTRAGMVNGERSDQNNISLDGVSNNNEFAGLAFNGILPTTPFSVEEFRVTTSNYDASAGRSSGAQISLVTKGGTNQYHGSLYEFNRNNLGEANDWFAEHRQLSNGLPNKPLQLVWNNYGGTIGGPVLKNRLFFFFNYEGHRQNVAGSATRTIPSAMLQDGIIQYACKDPTACTGMNVTGASGKSYQIQSGSYALGPTQLAAMDPAGIGPSPGVLAYFHTYPQPNMASNIDSPNYGAYQFGAPTTTRENWYIARIDYNLTQNGDHALFFRGEGLDENYGNASFLPGRPPMTKAVDLAKGLVAGYTSVFGPRFVNNVRYGLTRDSYGSHGDSNLPWVFMRELDQDVAYSSGDTAPVHNIVDTANWTKGPHNLQFGFNFLLSRLNTYDYGANYSDAVTNADWLVTGGFANKNDPLDPTYTCPAHQQWPNCGYGPTIDPNFDHSYDFPLAALMGIESEVDGSFNYSVGSTSGTLLGPNKPIVRHWAVDTYNLFFQDNWKVRRNLSITYGLNYQLMMPMTETAGQQVSPTVNMGTWFNQRQAAMYAGIPNSQVMGGALIGFGPSGSYYGKPGLYSAQTKNFAPRLGIAWTPHSDAGFLSKLLGDDKTVIRAGAGMYYSNFGPELAQFYSSVGEYGLSTQVTNPSASLPLNAAPRVGSSLSDMNVIPLSLLSTLGLMPPSSISFPQTPQGYSPGVSTGSFAITHGIDQSLKTPYSYALDLSIQRQLPGKMTLDVAYVGHFAHRLLVLDDVAAPMNLVDPKSKIDFFSAAKQMSKLWRQLLSQSGGDWRVAESNFNDSMVGPTAAYWQNMLTQQTNYPMCSGISGPTTDFLLAMFDAAGLGCGSLYNETSDTYDYDVYGLLPWSGFTFFPSEIKNGPYAVYDSQYSSLWDWRSIAWSNYNALQVSLHKQMSHGLMFGVNYTYSKSLDVESMAERGVHYLTDSVINAWNPRQMYGPGDADLRHQINGYWVAQLPFGRGKAIAGNASKLVDAIIGGWQLGGTTRWTSGFPVSVFMGYYWPTNWDEMGWADLTGSPAKTGKTLNNGIPNIFKNPGDCTNTAIPCAKNGFTYAYPGESGVRNPIRGDGYFATDMNLSKRWKITEGQSLELRWSAFNAFNNVRFDAYSMQDMHDQSNLVPPNYTTFGNYTSTLTTYRRMELAGIYRF